MSRPSGQSTLRSVGLLLCVLCCVGGGVLTPWLLPVAAADRAVPAAGNDAPVTPEGKTTTVPSTAESLPPLPTASSPPTDPDRDGLFEDLNANGRIDYEDSTLLFANFDRPVVTDNAAQYDFNRNGLLDFDDVVRLYQLSESSAPAVTIAPENDSVNVGGTLQLVAVVTGDADTPDDRSYEWRQIRGPANASLNRSSSASLSVSLPEAGTYVFEVVVSDGDARDRATVSVEASNALPTVSAYTTSPSSPTPGEPVTFEAELAAFDGTIRAYQWDVDGDGTTDVTTSVPTTRHTYRTPGRYATTVTVVTGTGAQVNATRTLDVEADAATTTETVLDTGFESTPVNGSPANWTATGNGTQRVVDAPAASGDRAFEVSGSAGGCQEAVAERSIRESEAGTDTGAKTDARTTELSFSIRPTTNGQVGCHAYNAAIELRTATDDGTAGDGLRLLTFRPSGMVTGSGMDLGAYHVGAWNNVTVEYTHSDGMVTITYEINGESRGTTTRAARHDESAPSAVTVRSGEFTTQLDDVVVERIAEGSALPIDANATAAATGHGHFTTFDGVSYDFQAAGEFVLAKDPTGSRAVQARLRPVPGAPVSVVSAVATRLDGRVVTIDARDDEVLTVNGTARSLAAGESVRIGSGRITRDSNGRTYTIAYTASERADTTAPERLTVDVWATRVDAALTLDGSRRADMNGLLGSPNGNARDDIAYPNGTALQRPVPFEALYGLYRTVYRVTGPTSLFDYDGGDSPQTFYDPEYPSERATVADLDLETRAEARQQARSAGLTPGTPAFTDAVLDVALSGEGTYLDSAKRAAAVDPTPSDATPMAALRFGDRRVANGTTAVVVESTTYTGGAYAVVIYTDASPDDSTADIGTRIGRSVTLGPGRQTNVTVTLDQQRSSADEVAALRTNRTLVARLHRVDDGTVGEPLRSDGTTTSSAPIVTDSADVTVASETDIGGQPTITETSETTIIERQVTPTKPLNVSLEGMNGTTHPDTETELTQLRLSATRDVTVEAEVTVSPTSGSAPTLEGASAYLWINESVSEDAINRVTFEFTIVADTVSTPESIVLYRYHDGAWTALETTYLGPTGGGERFEAHSPGLSVFAVGESTNEDESPASRDGDSPEETTDGDSGSSSDDPPETDDETEPDDSVEDDDGVGSDAGEEPTATATDAPATPSTPASETVSPVPDDRESDATKSTAESDDTTPQPTAASQSSPTAVAPGQSEPAGVAPLLLGVLVLGVITAVGALLYRRR